MIQHHSRKIFRANLDDVENLSYGRGAKKQRGTGSRFTCHRLNRDERRVYEQAKRDGFLTVKGTGYRKNRKGSPVGNTFRQRCDALSQVCVTVEKRSDLDRVVIDLSPLRVRNDSSLVSFLIEAVFREGFPEIFEAFVSHNHNVGNCQKIDSTKDNDRGDNNGNSLIQVENNTYRRIHWEAVKTKPIWGVDERLLAVSCNREKAKSIAMGVLKAMKSSNFIELQTDAENLPESIILEPATTTAEAHRMKKEILPKSETRTRRATMDENLVPEGMSSHSETGDCIDWDDI